MTKPNWIKTLVIACLIAWFLVISLVNSLDKRTPTTLMTADNRWSKLTEERVKLEAMVAKLTANNLDAARQLISVYCQQNQFSKAEELAARVSKSTGDRSVKDLETLASIERQKGDYEKSIGLLETIAKLDEHDVSRAPRDLINLGTLHYLKGLSLKDSAERKASFAKAHDLFSMAETQLPSGSEKTAPFIALQENKALNERELKKLAENQR